MPRCRRKRRSKMMPTIMCTVAAAFMCLVYKNLHFYNVYNNCLCMLTLQFRCRLAALVQPLHIHCTVSFTRAFLAHVFLSAPIAAVLQSLLVYSSCESCNPCFFFFHMCHKLRWLGHERNLQLSIFCLNITEAFR